MTNGDIQRSKKDDPVSLAHAIREAFRNTAKPKRDLVPYSNYPEAMEVAERFDKFKAWHDIPPDLLFYHRGDLTWMTPIGLRYYLPAYLVRMLEDYDNADTMPESVLAVLRPDCFGSSSGFRDWIREFNNDQLNLLIRVLRWIANQDDSIREEAIALSNLLTNIRSGQ